MNKEIATALVDILVAAHVAYKENRGRAVASLVYDFKQDGLVKIENFRESCSLCLFVYRLALGGKTGEVYRLFEKTLVEMYGESDDPFSTIPGGGFFTPKINFAVRSREAMRIAKYIEEKYL